MNLFDLKNGDLIYLWLNIFVLIYKADMVIVHVY
jgi:hypothetical protein